MFEDIWDYGELEMIAFCSVSVLCVCVFGTREKGEARNAISCLCDAIRGHGKVKTVRIRNEGFFFRCVEDFVDDEDGHEPFCHSRLFFAFY